MNELPPRPLDAFVWGDVTIEPDSAREVEITFTETFSGVTIKTPVMVWRGPEPGPVVFVSGAVHGDEINGAGAIREFILRGEDPLRRGGLILAPVVNMLGFERHSRYLPDRRDLNRAFPGSETGSRTARLARAWFSALAERSHFGVDLHTAAVRRTNFPNVRADMGHAETARIARAFGCELIVNKRGPEGSLRREAVDAGCATIILEAGEVWKVQPSYVDYAMRGIRNVLTELGMIDGDVERPPYQIVVDTTEWVRAQSGGFLHFHVRPGDFVEKGEAIATTTTLFGEDRDALVSPKAGVVLGMTTMPSAAPGDPVCHLAYPKKGVIRRMERARDALSDDSLHEQARGHLAAAMFVIEVEDDDGSADTPSD